MNRSRLLLVALLLCGFQVSAQVVVDTIDLRAVAVEMDSVAEGADEVVSSTDDILFMDGVAVDESQWNKVIASPASTSFNNSAYFLEMTLSFADIDCPEPKIFASQGVQFSYVPNRWGAYVGGGHGWLADRRYGQMAGGVVLRPVVQPSLLDWHLYGGLVARYGQLGVEVGTRFCAGGLLNPFDFALSSFTFSLQRLPGGTYYTVGFSLDLTALLLLALL